MQKKKKRRRKGGEGEEEETTEGSPYYVGSSLTVIDIHREGQSQGPLKKYPLQSAFLQSLVIIG